MKKYKNIRQLSEEKKRLKSRRAELEKAIRYDWRDVKDSLKPGNIAGQMFFGKGEEKNTSEKNDSGILSEMAAKFASKLASKAEDKLKDTFTKWFRK